MTEFICCFCPKCGQLSITHTCSTTSNLESPERPDATSNKDEAILLKNESSQLEALTEQLQEELAERCERLNEVQSATAELPSEILSTIFRFACSGGSQVPILALSSVSYRWRRTALELPELWRHLDIRLYGAERPVACANLESLLDLFYQRSNHQLLDIRRLNLQVPGSFWSPYLDSIGPQLTELRLCCGRAADYFEPHDFDSFPWLTQITVLETGGVSTLDAFKLLLKCTSLVKFRYYEPSDYEELYPCAPVTLFNLKRLEWDGVAVNNHWGKVVPRSIRAPFLEQFCWIDRESHDNDSITIAKLYRKLQNILSCASATLLELEIYFPSLRAPETQKLLREVAQLAPNLRALSLAAHTKPTMLDTIADTLQTFRVQPIPASTPFITLERLYYITLPKNWHGIGSRTVLEKFMAEKDQLGELFRKMEQEQQELLGASEFRVVLDCSRLDVEGRSAQGASAGTHNGGGNG
ncbi:hypothetical protein NP233_g4056 [Leucocoprinus birnbaumii]|uniref:F-box domain-containing protein n=1 Tax=Leucocoprinus birnbaumii TaxID=56174 RepID=A0AAD5VW55_9AGAR|nr:hypothetical protein NP233_g4056 [Leucocoprinus birnbaumii]